MRPPRHPNTELLGNYDEWGFELTHIIEDFRFARDMLRRLGPEEHYRFSVEGWSWGNNINYGGAPEEILDGQLASVLETLGLDLAGEFFFAYTEGELPEDGLLTDLLRPDGKPLGKEDIDPPGVWSDDVLVAELRGRAREVRRLHRGLLAVKPDLTVYHARPGSETHERLTARPAGALQALFFLLPGELGMLQQSAHDGLFEWLIRDWEVRNGKRAPETRPKNRGRARALRGPARGPRAVGASPLTAGRAPGGPRDGRPGGHHAEDHRLRGLAQRPGGLLRRERARKGSGKEAFAARPPRGRAAPRRDRASLRQLLRRHGRDPSDRKSVV